MWADCCHAAFWLIFTPGLDDRLGGVREHEHGDRAGDAELVGGGRRRRPRVEERVLDAERRVDVLRDRAGAFVADRVDELAPRQRDVLVEAGEERVRDLGGDAGDAQRVELGLDGLARRRIDDGTTRDRVGRRALDGDRRPVVDDADGDGDADHRAGARAGTVLRFGVALGVERELLVDRHADLEILVRSDHGARADHARHVVVGEQEGECTGDAELVRRPCVGGRVLLAVGLRQLGEQQVGDVRGRARS